VWLLPDVCRFDGVVRAPARSAPDPQALSQRSGNRARILREGRTIDGERWFRVYRAAFFVALFVATLVRVYFLLGFPPELASRGEDRFLRGFDVNLWASRLGSVAYVLTVAAAAAVVVSLATRTYRRLGERQADPERG
jgi:hypothetical protein